MKNAYLLLFLFLLAGCCKTKSDKAVQVIEKQQKKIDSLQEVLKDCKAQAKIMAEVLENEPKKNDGQ